MDEMEMLHNDLQALADAEGIGMDEDAEELMDNLISRVVEKIRDTGVATLAAARAALPIFVVRMVVDARARRSAVIDALAFRSARKQCGIIFWCE
jgi:hypothetical protein